MTPRPPRSFLAALPVVAVVAFAASVAVARPRADTPPVASGACDRYGPGYRPLAGTDTCVRVSGSVRAEMGFVVSGSGSEVGAYLGRPRR